jgi:hypothetical protein
MDENAKVREPEEQAAVNGTVMRAAIADGPAGGRGAA